MTFQCLLGVPLQRKVPLVIEKNYWDKDLVPLAKDALTEVFNSSVANPNLGAESFG